MNDTVQTKEIVLAPVSMPMSRDISEEFGLTQSQWRVLVDQIFPNAKTQEAVAMALSYCKTRKLDIFKRPVHIVPMYSAALKREVETVWPGISEIRTTAARTGEYAGIDEVVYGPEEKREFTAEKDIWENKRKIGTETITKIVRFPKWASVVVYRWVKGEKAAFHTKIFWEETFATQGKLDIPNAMWAKRPYGQFDKCLEAAALRKAFPEELGNTYAAEEMEGRIIDHDREERHPPATPKPPAPPPPPVTVIENDPLSPTEDDGEPFDAAAFFEELEGALAGAPDEATIEEVWVSLDPEATFDGDDTNLEIAHKIKGRRLAQVNVLNAG